MKIACLVPLLWQIGTPGLCCQRTANTRQLLFEPELDHSPGFIYRGL